MPPHGTGPSVAGQREGGRPGREGARPSPDDARAHSPSSPRPNGDVRGRRLRRQPPCGIPGIASGALVARCGLPCRKKQEKGDSNRKPRNADPSKSESTQTSELKVRYSTVPFKELNRVGPDLRPKKQAILGSKEAASTKPKMTAKNLRNRAPETT